MLHSTNPFIGIFCLTNDVWAVSNYFLDLKQDELAWFGAILNQIVEKIKLYLVIKEEKELRNK